MIVAERAGELLESLVLATAQCAPKDRAVVAIEVNQTAMYLLLSRCKQNWPEAAEEVRLSGVLIRINPKWTLCEPQAGVIYEPDTSDIDPAEELPAEPQRKKRRTSRKR